MIAFFLLVSNKNLRALMLILITLPLLILSLYDVFQNLKFDFLFSVPQWFPFDLLFQIASIVFYSKQPVHRNFFYKLLAVLELLWSIFGWWIFLHLNNYSTFSSNFIFSRIFIYAVFFVLLVAFAVLFGMFREALVPKMDEVQIAQILKMITIVKCEGAETCSICLSTFEQNEEIGRLPCNHSFHAVCIYPWVKFNHNSCPLCRQMICIV
jgi:hypothetical protein